MPPSERRLSAILHADLAGFVRLVEAEEDLTFERLRSARGGIWQPAIEGAGGSLIHSTGDAMLAEFGSAAAAVEVAIDIQERMARFNEGLAEEQRLLFRIGVHLGEIIFDETGHDIFGDGVNLAERIQVLAEPGGIAVSRAVRDVARLRDDYAYIDGGEHRAKHVSRPLHIYRVRARMGAVTVPSRRAPLRGVVHFHGADDSGRKFGFDVAMDELVRRQQSVLIGRDAERMRCRPVEYVGVQASRATERGRQQHPADRGRRIDQRYLDQWRADRSRAVTTSGARIDAQAGRYRTRRPLRLALQFELELSCLEQLDQFRRS